MFQKLILYYKPETTLLTNNLKDLLQQEDGKISGQVASSQPVRLGCPLVDPLEE